MQELVYDEILFPLLSYTFYISFRVRFNVMSIKENPIVIQNGT